MKSLKNHVDPQKEEQLQWQKKEVENQVKRIMKLTKTINHGNKEANLKKKSELVQLVQDFNQQYESLYSVYADLKDEVKKNVDHNRSLSSSDSENYYSPDESSSTKSSSSSEGSGSGRGGFVIGPNKKTVEDFDLEHMMLKDKLTHSSEVKDLDKVFVDELNVEDKESQARTKELEAKIVILKNECEALGSDKRRLEHEAIKMSEKISSLQKCVSELESKESEIPSLNNHKEGLEVELKDKSDEIEHLKNELVRYQSLTMEGKDQECLIVKIKDLECEIASLNRRNADLESEAALKEELKRKTSQLKKSLSDCENKVKKLESQVQLSDSKIQNLEKALGLEQDEKSSLQEQLRSTEKDKAKLEQKNAELTDKITNQQKTLIELGSAMSELKKENERAQIIRSVSKSDFKIVEKKIEETAEAFRKQFEDKHRMLSRRIRVAEQLHVENKEWYRVIKERYDQETKDLQTALKGINDLSLSANETLDTLDSTLMRLEERNSNFLNRVSKSSCELKFAKDWVKRKNEALAHARAELERANDQLDRKESEILGFRERVWRCDGRVRELEKMVKERDDAMLGLEEEKREAIRQLCVWIDYHRSRSDYYMKALSENHVVGRKKSN